MNKKFAVTAPLFDRLTDLDPFVSTEMQVLKTCTLQDLQMAVMLDTEDLLNTRYSQIPHSYAAFVQAFDGGKGVDNASLLRYGLPDFVQFVSGGINNGLGLEYFIKTMIEQYEPRLQDVEVIIGDFNVNLSKLDVYIRAVLSCDVNKQRFTFSSSIQNISSTA